MALANMPANFSPVHAAYGGIFILLSLLMGIEGR